MTVFSGGGDNNSDFDGNSFLLECEDGKYVYSSGRGFLEFRTDDKNVDYIPLVGNNMIPYAIMVEENYAYFLYNRYKFIENDKIGEGTLINATNNSLDPHDYHVEKCGVHSFKKLERRLVHTFWPDHGEDQDQDQNEGEEEEREDEGDLLETNYTNRNNEGVKIFIQ